MKREKLNNDKITALYCGLSKDDGTNNESISISTQKTMLKDYAKRNGFLNCQFYVDDAAIIGLNQKTFCLRVLPIKSYFFTLFTHPHLPRGEFLSINRRLRN